MPVSPQKRNELLERMKALEVFERDLDESFVRGSGKGGQKHTGAFNLTHSYAAQC